MSIWGQATGFNGGIPTGEFVIHNFGGGNKKGEMVYYSSEESNFDYELRNDRLTVVNNNQDLLDIMITDISGRLLENTSTNKDFECIISNYNRSSIIVNLRAGNKNKTLKIGGIYE